jgi:uncharacterized protein YndB with AHSA1/START domain
MSHGQSRSRECDRIEAECNAGVECPGCHGAFHGRTRRGGGMAGSFGPPSSDRTCMPGGVEVPTSRAYSFGMPRKVDSHRCVSVERTIAASPQEVWGVVADVTRIGNWSPETTGAEWLGDADTPSVGARFRGTNHKDSKSWKTNCVVTACEPGVRFGFDVKAGPFKVARWTYEFRLADTGCRVIERWDDQRNWLLMQVSPLVTGVKDRATRNQETMNETLDRIAATLEQHPSG